MRTIPFAPLRRTHCTFLQQLCLRYPAALLRPCSHSSIDRTFMVHDHLSTCVVSCTTSRGIHLSTNTKRTKFRRDVTPSNAFSIAHFQFLFYKVLINHLSFKDDFCDQNDKTKQSKVYIWPFFVWFPEWANFGTQK